MKMIKELFEELAWKFEVWEMKYHRYLLTPKKRREEEEWSFHNLQEDKEKLQKTIKHQRKIALKKIKLEKKKEERKRRK